MPLILPGNVASATAATGFNIENSCRWSEADSARMTLTQGSTSDAIRQKFTFSCWFKIGNLAGVSGERTIYGIDNGSVFFYISIGGADNIRVGSYSGVSSNYDILTTALIRDPSAWYSLVVACDSTDGTAANRVKVYLNGTQITVFDTANYPAQNYTFEANGTVAGYIGSDSGSTFFDGYLAEIMMVTGSQLAPTAFGEFDEDSPTIWKPIDISEQAVGTNGFYLDFKDSSNLGNDASGGTDWSEANITAADQAVDTPTNNFCVMNHLDNYYESADFAKGNCKITTDNGTYNTSTFALSSGKWYMECEMDYDAGVGDYWRLGIVDRPSTGVNVQFGAHPNSYCADQGSVVQYGTNSTFGAPFVDGDIISVALDLDNNTIAWANNGAYGGGVGSASWSGSLSATHSITAAASTLHGHYFIAGAANDETSGGYRMLYNFGGCSPFDVASANQDENGYGNFEFAVPSGYLALCTKNLGSDGG